MYWWTKKDTEIQDNFLTIDRMLFGDDAVIFQDK